MGKPTKRKSKSANKSSKRRKGAKAEVEEELSDADENLTAADLDVDAVKAEAAAQAELEKDAPKDEEDPENDEKADPYLMADATYIQKDTRWRNKQRSLVFCSPGVTARFRHLCDDIRKMMPHHKTEAKFEKRSNFNEINEICELKNCNNVVFFEARKREDLYLWVGRVPSGPSMKFQVLNVHTTQEVRLAGNCLLGSRPILYFDKNFNNVSYLKLIKEVFTQVFGTPRNHPKSKPFHDHIMCFYWLDKKIWFRHYQISPETPEDANKPEKQVLTEIGPRFVLDPIRIFGGSFSGQTLYLNPHYMSPTALRVQARKLLKNPYVKKLEDKEKLEQRKQENQLPEDPVDETFA